MKREEILELMKAKDAEIQADIDFKQVITSAKQEDDKVVLGALNFLAILLAFVVLWIFIYLVF